MIDKNDPRLTGFVLGELSPADNAEIQSAISDSAELKNAVDEIRQTASLLGAAYKTEPPLCLLEEQKAELVLMQADDATRELKLATSQRPWLPIAMAASLMTLLVGGAMYLQNAPLSREVADRAERIETLDRDQLDSLKANAATARARKKNPNGPADERELERNRSIGIDVDELPANKNESTEEVEKFVYDFNKLVDEQRFAEASNLARKVGKLSPGSDIAGVLDEKAKILNRIANLKDAKEEGSWSAMSNVEQSLPAPGGTQPSSELDWKFKRGVDDDGVAGGIAPGVDPSQLGRSMQQADGQGRVQGGYGGRGGGMGGGMGGGGFGGGGGLGVDQENTRGRQSGGERGGRGELAANQLGQILTDDEAKRHQPQQQRRRASRDGVELESKSDQRDSTTIAGVATDDSSSQTRVTPYSEAERLSEIVPSNAQGESRPRPAPASPALGNSNLRNLAQGKSGGKEQRFKFESNNLSETELRTDAGQQAERPVEAARQAADPRGVSNGLAKLPAESGAASGDGVLGVLAGESEEDESADLFSLPADDKPRSLNLNLDSDSGDRDSGIASLSKGLEIKPEELARMEDLGIQIGSRIQKRRETRVVPVQRTRPEIRSRKIELADGSTKIENYTVEVPYTEKLAQDITVEEPKAYFKLTPETTERFVDNLAKEVNPDGTREVVVEQLFSKARELSEQRSDKGGETKKDVEIALKILEQFGEDEDPRFDVTPALKQVEHLLKQRNAKVRKARTWKRVKAIPNTTRLMVGDKNELDLTGMQVNVQVDGFRARVLLDYFYYNDRGRPLDGNFKLRLPDDASLYYFAFGESSYNLNPQGTLATEEFLDDGTRFVSLRAEQIRDARKDAWANVKESRMVPRERAAHAYIETVRRKVDPALVEWSGAGVFNAQVSPLAPNKLHRIVIGYDVNLTKVANGWIYELDLPEQTGQCQVDINVQSVDGVEYAVEPSSDPSVQEIGGKSQRRYRFVGPQDETIRLTAKRTPDMLLSSAGEFWGVQFKPELPVEKVDGNARAIFMVDTSLSSNPDKFNVWLKLLESTLENNSDSLKQFNVVFFNVDAHFWQEKWVDNTQENIQLLMEKCNTLALEGATDLYGAIDAIASADWVQRADGSPTAGPDLFLLSDGAANWGETNLRLISQQLQDHQLGSLFAYQTGMTGTAISGLRFLAGQSGGAVFSVASEAEVKVASTAHRKRPWQLTAISGDGASDIMTAGRVQWVYPGQSITIVGRGLVQDRLTLEMEQSGYSKSVSFSPLRIESELAARLYGQVAVGQLESLGAEVFDVAASYARHFRVTGDTCSLVMLESEADYQRFGIKPHEDLFVIKSKNAKDLVANTLEKSAAELADPKAQFLSWASRLESMPGMEFTMPPALKFSLDDIEVVAISKPLDCNLTQVQGLSKEYLAALQSQRLDYDVIATEANRRGATSVDDAIKVFSSLVERNPGDLVIARDVAFTALELGRPAQAYHLLRSVAKARPFEGSIYPALGQCLTQLGQSDMAVVYYEIALGGTFSRMGDDFQKIVSAEYMYLLRQISEGKLDSSIKDFADARLETLKKTLGFESANLVITMMWNTDQTDVDLHIFEPSGEECSYENKKTRSGGQITTDITTGYGPEMYFNPSAPQGKYDIKVKYFASNQNRTELRNKVHLTIYRGFGSSAERVTRKTVQLKKVGEKEAVGTVGVD